VFEAVIADSQCKTYATQAARNATHGNALRVMSPKYAARGFSGALAHSDVRARAYRDVFTASPEDPSRCASGTRDAKTKRQSFAARRVLDRQKISAAPK
jgi:hypothetical protein